MKNIIQTVDFHGQTLIAIPKDGQLYVGMKVICENIGIDWRSQRQRIMRNEVMKAGVVMITTPSKGGKQETLCLPLPMLNGWLFGIDVNRVKESATRDLLIQYQRECFGVLYDYWHKGEAKNPRATTPDERAGLRAAVTMLTTKRGLMHDEAYRLVHQRFNVDHIDKLTREQLPEAVEYVQRLALSGELLPREDRDAEKEAGIRNHQAAAISLMHIGRMRYQEQKEALRRLRDDAMQAMDALDAAKAALGRVLAQGDSIFYGSGAIWDGLHESLFHLMLPDDVMEEGRRRAQKHYKPRILG